MPKQYTDKLRREATISYLISSLSHCLISETLPAGSKCGDPTWERSISFDSLSHSSWNPYIYCQSSAASLRLLISLALPSEKIQWLRIPLWFWGMPIWRIPGNLELVEISCWQQVNRAGVSGLTTAYLLSQNASNSITVVAKHMPGDYDIEYCSPWAGANYLP